MYQTHRYKTNTTATVLTYSFNVPNGDYQVKLHFAEVAFNAAGLRVFNINIEGATAFSNLDVWSQAGGKNKALVKTADVAVSDGQLNIQFIRNIENPMVSGIEIIEN